MAESSELNSTAGAEKVILTPKNMKSPVWKYIGFWSVDGNIVEPGDKVLYKLCEIQLAYHSRVRSAVLAISSFTYFCIGNMLSNMFNVTTSTT